MGEQTVTHFRGGVMRETDEVAKCMWFLADTGWTVRDYSAYVEFQCPNGTVGVLADDGSNPYIYYGGKSHYVEDLFTALVVAYEASRDPAILDRVVWTNNDNSVHGTVSGMSVMIGCPRVAQTTPRLVPMLDGVASETARIVRLDARETRGDFVWTIYWQEADDGEA